MLVATGGQRGQAEDDVSASAGVNANANANVDVNGVDVVLHRSVLANRPTNGHVLPRATKLIITDLYRSRKQFHPVQTHSHPSLAILTDDIGPKISIYPSISIE